LLVAARQSDFLYIRSRMARLVWYTGISCVAGVLLYLSLLDFVANIHYRRGLAYDENMLWDEAVEEYQRATSLDPHKTTYHKKVGNLFFRMARLRQEKETYYTKAIQEYARAIQFNPLDGFSYNELGWVFLWKEDLGQAVFYFKEAIQRDPNNVFFHGSLGSAYKRQGKLEEAQEEYEFVLTLFPNNPQANKALGEIKTLLRKE